MSLGYLFFSLSYYKQLQTNYTLPAIAEIYSEVEGQGIGAIPPAGVKRIARTKADI
jgi:hypothetical protein